MSLEIDRAIREVRAAASNAGDVSGNCEEALCLIEHAEVSRAAERMEWAEQNVKSTLNQIARARAAIAKATGGAA